MTKGYLVCCQYRHRGWEPEEDTFHSFVVFTNRDEALKELRTVYEEQKDIVLEALDENEELATDELDEVRGTFSVSAMFGDEHADGFISEVRIKL